MELPAKDETKTEREFILSYIRGSNSSCKMFIFRDPII